MTNGSYHEYLNQLHIKENSKSHISHVIFMFFSICIIFVSFVSAFLLYQFNLEEPIRKQITYLNLADKGLKATSSSLDEIITTFNVQGQKISAIDSLKDDGDIRDGYLIYLSELQKNKVKVDASIKNINFQKNALVDFLTPQGFEKLNSDLILYFDQSIKSLEQIQKEHQFFIDVHLALGPSLYIPSLSSETVWKGKQKEEIKKYYETMKNEASLAFENLTKIHVYEDYQEYFDAQIKYLEKLVILADNVTKILEKESEDKNDAQLQIEEAYNFTINSRNELATTSEFILTQRIKLVDSAKNIEDLVPVRFRENSLKNLIAQNINDINYVNTLSQKIEVVVSNLASLQIYSKF